MTRRTLLPALLAILVGASPAHAWTWPADGPVLQRFIFGDNPYAAGLHRGIDVAAPTGTPVRAPHSGTVTFAGSVPRHGRTVTIETPDGYAVTLVHLAGVAVSRGSRVAEGATVGTIGPSGDPEHAVPYVHLGVRVAAEPQGYVDPLLLLPSRELPPGASPGDGGTTSDGAVVEPVASGAASAEATSGDAKASDGAATPHARDAVELPAARSAEAELPLPETAEMPTSQPVEASAETAVVTEHAEGQAATVSAGDGEAGTGAVPAEDAVGEEATEAPRPAAATAEAAGDGAAEAPGEAAVEAPSDRGTTGAPGGVPGESSEGGDEAPPSHGVDTPAGEGGIEASGDAPAEAVGDVRIPLPGDQGTSEAGGGFGDERADAQTEVPAPLPAEAPVPVPVEPAAVRGSKARGASPAVADVRPAGADEGGVARRSGAADGESGTGTTRGAFAKPGVRTARTQAGRDAVDGAKSSTVPIDEPALGEPSERATDERDARAPDRRGDADADSATRLIVYGALVLPVVLLAALAFLAPARAGLRRRPRGPAPQRAVGVRRRAARLDARVRGSELRVEQRERVGLVDGEIGVVRREDGRLSRTPELPFVPWTAGMPLLESLDLPAERGGNVGGRPVVVRTAPEGTRRLGARGNRRLCRRRGPSPRRIATIDRRRTGDYSTHQAAGCRGEAAQRPRRLFMGKPGRSGHPGLSARGARAGVSLPRAARRRARTKR